MVINVCYADLSTFILFISITMLLSDITPDLLCGYLSTPFLSSSARAITSLLMGRHFNYLFVQHSFRSQEHEILPILTWMICVAGVMFKS